MIERGYKMTCGCGRHWGEIKPDVIILFSGGADSVLLVEFAESLNLTPFCVLIDYQQLHIQELEVAEKFLNERSISYKRVKLHELGICSGLTGDGTKDRFEGVHSMHVPSRNLMFVSIAASIAEDKGADTIWLGCDWDDYLNEFPDCKQEWIGRVNKVLQINGPNSIKLEAPLLGLSKENVLGMLRDREIDGSQIFSGYGGL